MGYFSPPPPPPLIDVDALLANPLAVMLGVLAVLFLLQAGGKSSGGGGLEFLRTLVGQNKRKSMGSKGVDKWIGDYNKLHHNADYVKEGDKAGVEERNSMYASMVNAYYELATSFYEWGWGQSFHFAQRKFNEGAPLPPRRRRAHAAHAHRARRADFNESIRRHEYYLASHLELTPGQRVLDVGCGIGGPYRNISRFTRCDVTGITLNEYQVQRANQINASLGMDGQVRSLKCDFMDMGRFKDSSFDAVYAIEATCHAPVRQGVYGEIMRVLKPGAVFACYEWVLTDKYKPRDAAHR
jgi:sterol 24-C-methyltransferase